MQERYCGPPELASKYNQFAPNGAAMISKILNKNVSITEGEEHIAYFRASVSAPPYTAEYDEEHRTASVYAKCCGTLILHHGQGFLLEFHSSGIEGFERKEESNGAQATMLFTYCCDQVGTKIPEGAQIAMFQGIPCCTLCNLMCCSGVMCTCCNSFCCCRSGGPPAFGVIPEEAGMYMGKTVEYIKDEKYLIWPSMRFNDIQFVPKQDQMVTDKAGPDLGYMSSKQDQKLAMAHMPSGIGVTVRAGHTIIVTPPQEQKSVSAAAALARSWTKEEKVANGTPLVADSQNATPEGEVIGKILS